ncbi:MAG: hypothetical protein O6947_06630 [Acidobacteria bacterium]|nr:hypothetical protein [Acidobacteriota bacterium]
MQYLPPERRTGTRFRLRSLLLILASGFLLISPTIHSARPTLGDRDAVGKTVRPIRVHRISGVRASLEKMKNMEAGLKHRTKRVLPRPPLPPPISIRESGVEAMTPPDPSPLSTAGSLLQSFPGLIDSNTRIPPDTQGAAGPDHLVSILNTEFAIFNKSTGSMLRGFPIDMRAFWAPLGDGPGEPAENPFDPKILFDQYSQRWILAADSNPNDAAAAILVAVSLTADPTAGFDLFAIPADPAGQTWADFPGLGVDPGWVYVTNNTFTVKASPAFAEAKFWLIDKGSLLSGGPLVVQEFLNTVGGSTWQPAHAFGPTAVNYIVSENWTASGTSRFLRIQVFSFPAGTPVLTDLGFLQVADYGIATLLDATQFMIPERIETNDTRLLDAVLRNGKLWTIHHVDGSMNAGQAEVSWYELEPRQADANGTAGPLRQGRIGDIEQHFFYPSIGVNAFECLGFGFTGSSPLIFATGYFAFRKASDPPGGFHGPEFLKIGNDPYFKDFGKGRNRWGDYSATVVDPADDRTFWTLQEYAEQDVGNGPNDDRWGTWWGGFTCGCSTDADCDDGIACNGQESCNLNTLLCQTGPPAFCGDGSCQEVDGLRLNPAGTLGLEVSLDWAIEPELQSFNLYRSTTPDLGDLSCIAQEIFRPPLLDSETLFPGDFRAYLVTGTDLCGNETTLGFSLPAGERQAPFPCN